MAQREKALNDLVMRRMKEEGYLSPAGTDKRADSGEAA
jgi:hypothetical protein